MGKGRLEAFSDGVFAIILTIMVLDLHVPHGAAWNDLRPQLPVFACYVLSYIYVGIYWNNHHHLLHAAEQVSGGILWANLHLLFWLSLAPFLTLWMGQTHFASLPVALYGLMLWLSSVAYFILTRMLIAQHGPASPLALAVGRDRKGMFSTAVYTAAIPLAFWLPYAACAGYALVTIVWLVPDRRIEDNPYLHARSPGSEAG